MEGGITIRKRNIHIQLWLNEKELATLNSSVQRSGLSREVYLRQLISGVVPREKPSPDFWAMKQELYYIGNNLNQIAQQAHALNAIDAKRYDEGVQLFRDAVEKILSAVLEPTPINE